MRGHMESPVWGIQVMNDFTFTARGFADYVYWQGQDRKTLAKINRLLASVRRDGAAGGMGKPEALKYRNGYSRRIDEKNRLVYEIDEMQNNKIISCRGHYED